MQIDEEISQALGIPVTITARDALHPLMKDNIEREAVLDRLAEIAIMFRIGARMTLPNFRSDPIVRRPVAYAIQTISEAVRHIPDEWLAQSKGLDWCSFAVSILPYVRRCAPDVISSNLHMFMRYN
jgi:hypothetical protein